jgi:allantoinase
MKTNSNPGWPQGKRVAVAIAVMYETWADGKAPAYSVQTTAHKAGTVDHASKAWSTYGGRVGVWRILRTLERHGLPATFFVNARCAELYPESVREVIASGHEVAAHAHTQDQLLAAITVDEQQRVIQESVGLLEEFCGAKPKGWVSPALSFTPETAGFLAQAGLKWHADVTYSDLPFRHETPHGQIIGVPTSDFTDNRVLRASPADLVHVYRSTFAYLNEHEPGSLMVVGLHAHFGGRPLITAAMEEILGFLKSSGDVWFPRYDELAQWATQQPQAESRYRDRFPPAR